MVLNCVRNVYVVVFVGLADRVQFSIFRNIVLNPDFEMRISFVGFLFLTAV